VAGKDVCDRTVRKGLYLTIQMSFGCCARAVREQVPALNHFTMVLNTRATNDEMVVWEKAPSVTSLGRGSPLCGRHRQGVIESTGGPPRGDRPDCCRVIATPPATAPMGRVSMGAGEGHSAGHRGRLRERFHRSGLDAMLEYEVVELLLTLAIQRSDVKQPAKELVRRFGNLCGILDAPPEELRSVAGIGSVAPVALQIVRAAAARYLEQAAARHDLSLSREAIADAWRMRIGALRNEVFEVALLDSGGRLLRDGVQRLTEGTIDRASVYPRRVVELALKWGAAALILAHNHPNGSVQPSEMDRLLTRAIVLAAEAVNLRVVDHLIVSPDEAFSFRTAGLL
jgi:DNA repair protein RadC